MKPPILRHNFEEGEYPISYFISPGRLVELKLDPDERGKSTEDILEKRFRDHSLKLLEHAPKQTGALIHRVKTSGKRLNMLHGHGVSDKHTWELEGGFKRGPYTSIPEFLDSKDCAGWFVDCCNPGEYEFQEGQSKHPIIYPGKSTSEAVIGFECPILSTGLNSSQGDLETTIRFLDLIWNSIYGKMAKWPMFTDQYNRIKQTIERAYR